MSLRNLYVKCVRVSVKIVNGHLEKSEGKEPLRSQEIRWNRVVIHSETYLLKTYKRFDFWSPINSSDPYVFIYIG